MSDPEPRPTRRPRRASLRDVCVVLVCGGRAAGERRDPDRALASLSGRTLAERAATAALGASVRPEIGALVVVAEAGDHHELSGLLARRLPSGTPAPLLVAPGLTPVASIHDALEAIAPRIVAGELRTVLVHDASWPLATAFLARETLAAARRHGSAAPCVALPDAIWVHDDGRTTGVPIDRDAVTVQFPQAFDAADLMHAFRREHEQGYPGGTVVGVYERRTGRTVRAIAGEARNIEIRRARDLFAAQLLLEVSDYVTS